MEETRQTASAKKGRRRNRYAGVLQPRQVGAGSPQVSVLVLYDVEDDRIRNKVSDICLDYGLQRIQYSAFLGKINRNRRQELSLRLLEQVGAESARIRIIPVSEDSLREMWVHDMYVGGRKPAASERVESPRPPRIRIVGSSGQ